MANPKHLAKLKEGVRTWNEWRKEEPRLLIDLQAADFYEANLDAADLHGANLNGAYLHGANLNGADLGGADLRETDLRGAYLGRADLHMADLHLADLRWTYLRAADLRGANLSGADLTGAELSEAHLDAANLSGANFQGANLSETDLGRASVGGTKFTSTKVAITNWTDVDLSEAVDLESIRHLGPSSVSLDTLVKSKGRIPDLFLRGCGVPDHLIEMQKSLFGDISPIQFYSCFISYSHKDEEFCRRLHSRMQQEALRVWFAPEEMKGGRKLHDQIDEAIRIYDKLLIVLSEASMGSNWVKTEIANARAKEKEQRRQVLFPIRLVSFDEIRNWKAFDADLGTDSAREIREYFIPDFSNWKNHDDFEVAFARLLMDLKASA